MTEGRCCIALVLASSLLLAACNRPPAQPGAAIAMQRPSAEGRRIAAAETFTRHYSRSRHADWKVRASAAGPQCGVLLVHVGLVIDDSMIEGMHYGGGAYDAYPGGAQQLQRERDFKGVAYRDAAGRVWTYDEVAPSDVETLVPCQ